jgi:hypothetical protein
MSEALVTTEKIIKTDTRGRLRTTAERREFLLDEFERSAMTGRKFADWAGIRYSTFGNWSRARKKLRRAELATTTGPENTTGPRWLEAVVKEPTLETQDRLKAGPLIVHGLGGVRLELSDASQIKLAAQLLRELGGSEGC